MPDLARLAYVTGDQQVAQTFAATRLLPVVTLDDAALAPRLAAALTRGGLNSIEITFRTPAAPAALRALAAYPGLLAGAGTVLTPEQVDEAVEAGARFVVSPGFAAAVVRRCQERGVPVFPGVATATELQTAIEAGLGVVKFFPAGQLGGPAMIKALGAPFPGIRFLPTGGVTAANLGSYLDVPAVLAVGGSWMAPPDLIRAGAWDEITERTAAAVAIAKGVTHAHPAAG